MKWSIYQSPLHTEILRIEPYRHGLPSQKITDKILENINSYQYLYDTTALRISQPLANHDIAMCQLGHVAVRTGIGVVVLLKHQADDIHKALSKVHPEQLSQTHELP